MATAVISALTRRAVRSDLAMTGEITLRGRVLAIGGLKEKALAAHRAGIRTLIVPDENSKDLAEIPAKVRSEMTYHLVETMDQVIELALLPASEPASKDEDRLESPLADRAALPPGLVPPAPGLYPVPEPATTDDISDHPSANQGG